MEAPQFKCDGAPDDSKADVPSGNSQVKDISQIIYTAGHSTRSLEEFLELLESYGIQAVVDVRRFPSSSKFPHFSRDCLCESLTSRGMKYFWLGDLLGGMRKGGYEEYTKTDEFLQGIEELERIASANPTCIVCAEKLFFRCHRRFICDRLLERGWHIIHIVEAKKTSIHKGRRN